MITFWENVIQLARFFISSVTGLIFIILSPLLAAKRNPIIASLVLGICMLILLSLYQVLQAMLGMNDIANIL
nr:Ycf33 [Erythrotrichia foliiformis]